jgi:hypothetical protein
MSGAISRACGTASVVSAAAEVSGLSIGDDGGGMDGVMKAKE